MKKSTPVFQEEELIEWNRYKRYWELISKDNERQFSKGEIVASIRGRNFGDLIRYDKKPQLSNSKVSGPRHSGRVKAKQHKHHT